MTASRVDNNEGGQAAAGSEPGAQQSAPNSLRSAPRGLVTQLATLALAALIVLCIAWEWRLAPLRPGGSLLVLKAVPLVLALPGVARRRLYTLQWASMLVLLYFMEGIVRGMSDRGLSASLGWSEVAVSVVFFVAALVAVAPFKRAARAAKRAAGERSDA
ncbi:DUF2069 domain-containing protein [Paraburkholderia phosphatilytica]|uniref:DUF2069 domain-containing protein n=1 Tax=Paraburkholderia phosphatilytica TaxID=2282883 RepID=UPI000E4A6DA3|nr:DUF2069 domain-containing protein [Paraburkholderia phosphatilytica]